MSEPVRDPETGGRSLADILREAGIENPSRSGRRRRWEDDDDDTGIRQRRARPVTDPSQPVYGRRSTDVRDGAPARGEQPARGPGAPHRDGTSHRDRATRRDSDSFDRPAPGTRSDRRHAPGRRAPDPSTAAIPGLRPSQKPDVPTGATAVPAAKGRAATAPGRRRPAAVDPTPATGPIPVVRDQGDGGIDDPLIVDELDAEPRDGALAWLRFAGELVIALAVGVGVYFAFTVIWEMVPYLAIIAAPLAVTGIVTGVSMWRHRLGREPAGARLVGILVFAGTLLTVLPAAGLLAAT